MDVLLERVIYNNIYFAEVHERDETVHPVHCCRPTQGHCQCSICGEENVETFEYDVDRMRMTQKKDNHQPVYKGFSLCKVAPKRI